MRVGQDAPLLGIVPTSEQRRIRAREVLAIASSRSDHRPFEGDIEPAILLVDPRANDRDVI
jgi:hypothetical protein